MDSVNRGWEIMSLCLMTFPPGEDFENYLFTFIKEKAPGGSQQKLISLLHEITYSSPKTMSAT